mmetsp:Transcript_43922/g.103923  ORF Transcript_43922/g.103923 Transcript_43922/m.103923 type:complete len:670 (-) Transcript_43922:72-2081(-)
MPPKKGGAKAKAAPAPEEVKEEPPEEPEVVEEPPPPTPEPVEPPVVLSEFIPPGRSSAQKFPASDIAVATYAGAVKRGFDRIVADASEATTLPEALQMMQETGGYEDVKKDLKAAVIRICRERLRKDVSIVPGQPMSPEARENFMSTTYGYLTSSMQSVLDDLRRDNPFQEPTNSKVSSTGGGMGGSEEIPVSAREDGLEGAGSKDQSKDMTQRKESPREQSYDVAMAKTEEKCVDPVAKALAEAAEVRRTREALGREFIVNERSSRLAFESELRGNWDVAAQNWQDRLILDENRQSMEVWTDYAKFCMRSGGRQEAAEEALRQAVNFPVPTPSEGEASSSFVFQDAEVMLGAVLLDRGRFSEAMAIFRRWHEKDITEPLFNFLQGLSNYLANKEEEAWKPFLAVAGMPQEWFDGLTSTAEVLEKYSKRNSGDAAEEKPVLQQYVRCLKRLLSFALPNLVFTFLDQCSGLPDGALSNEAVALIDAEASCLCGEYHLAATRLEPICTKAGASFDTRHVYGQCLIKMQEFDQAMHVLQDALAQESSVDDPAVFIRLGHVYLVKKRWKQAREAFLKSINLRPTAEAWSGIGYAEFYSDELHSSLEALNEAELLDNNRADVWNLLSMVHSKFQNTDLAESCMQQSMAIGTHPGDLVFHASQAGVGVEASSMTV